MDDGYLLGRIDHIQHASDGEEMWVRVTMASALIGIGKRAQQGRHPRC
ncbi:MAG: hypothetical protein ACKVHE_37450 [Planctomycetales bacterium]|jgi:hypothetical protein